MKRAACIVVFALFVRGGLQAQDLSGNWQTAVRIDGNEMRVILRLAKNAGGWEGSSSLSNDWGARLPVSSIALQGSRVTFSIAQIPASYDGTLSADGSTLTGTWTQRQDPPKPLEWRRAMKGTAWRDPSPHKVQLVTVDKDVRLEVLDWGGTGRPVVLLSGLGNTAHVFDTFARTLTPWYHVYGVTRRGFGDSSAPDSGYGADRLGDDVLAVLTAVKIPKPVLAGHSIAGSELSSIGTRHPERVAGLVYLDAGYAYAFYDPAVGASPLGPPPGGVVGTIWAGTQKYRDIRGPILAIFASPQDPGPAVRGDARQLEGFKTMEAFGEKQIAAFEKGLPNARVVRIPNARHYVFESNEPDVLREMNAFIGGLAR